MAAHDLQQTLSKGLTMFVSNSAHCLDKITKELCDNEKDKPRVLAVMLNTTNDTFLHQ